MQFLLEEQKQRRAEIENLIKRIEDDQRFGLVITGAIWSWLAANQGTLRPPFDFVIAAIPVMIMFFFRLRWRGLGAGIHRAAAYTIELERFLQLPASLGWESYLSTKRAMREERDLLGGSAYVYWRLLLWANAVIAILFLAFSHLLRKA
jgi:hypothetical protein